MTYSIGDPTNPKRTDERYDTAESAEIAAIEASSNGHVWAVWDDDDGELLSLILDYQVFLS